MTARGVVVAVGLTGCVTPGDELMREVQRSRCEVMVACGMTDRAFDCRRSADRPIESYLEDDCFRLDREQASWCLERFEQFQATDPEQQAFECTWPPFEATLLSSCGPWELLTEMALPLCYEEEEGAVWDPEP